MITDWLLGDMTTDSGTTMSSVRYIGALLSIGVAVLMAGDGAVGGEKAGVELFNGHDLKGWLGYGGEAINWEAVDGELRSKGGREGVRMLVTEKDYADFDFSMQFNAPADVNTGVFFRLPATVKGRPAFVGNEIQIVDEKSQRYAEKMTADRRMGAHYSVAAPRAEPPALRPNEWQSFRLRCAGSHLQVWIDEVLVQDADLSTYAEELKTAHPGLSETRGRIGLQSKDVAVRFRSLRIVELK